VQGKRRVGREGEKDKEGSRRRRTRYERTDTERNSWKEE